MEVRRMSKATEIPWRQRSAERLEIGEVAWIAFDAALRAKRVRVVACDDDGPWGHYEVEGLDGRDRGSRWSLFKDEVRRTPIDARRNCVTF
jgi:hypothetical protein